MEKIELYIVQTKSFSLRYNVLFDKIKNYRMSLTLYQIDAFTNQLFAGNPAGVCPLTEWLPTETMQNIAAENNLAETAFFVKEGEHFHLRWFTPTVEVDFCGHATLATSHVLFQHLNYAEKEITFQTRVGKLTISRSEDWYVMNFPADDIQEIKNPPEAILKSLNVEAKIIFRGRDDFLVIVDNQSVVENCTPDFRLLQTVKSRGVIVSAKGKETDCVSRGFFPQTGVNEDPVTGSAHTTLIPYWAKILGKNQLTARQISPRGGFLKCELKGDRVILSGQAVTYLKGEIFV